MDPVYKATISNQKERPKKRSKVYTDISHNDEEDRESKRKRLSSHANDQAMYARTPPGLYQQPVTHSRPDPYSFNDSMDRTSQHQTPVQRPDYGTQETIQDRHRRYEKITPGLGKSILTSNPFDEESDSNDDGPSDEADVQEANADRRSSSLFVNSSDSTRASQANFQNGRQYSREASRNSLSDDTSGIYSSDQQSQPTQTRDERSDQHYSYRVPTRDGLPHTSRGQHGGAENQPQPTTSHRVRLRASNIAPNQHASGHDQARNSRAVHGENSRSEHRYAPEMPVAQEQPLQTQAQMKHAFGYEEERDFRGSLREKPKSDRRYAPGMPVANQRPIQTQAGAANSLVNTQAHFRYEETEAHLPYETDRANIGSNVASHIPRKKPVTPPVARSSHENANHQTPPSGALPATVGRTRPRRPARPEGFNAPKSILDAVKPRESNTDKPKHRQYKENQQYPAQIAASTSPVYNSPVTPSTHITPNTPIAQPTARYDAPPPVLPSGSTTSDSVQEMINTIPEEQLRNFMPNSLDNRVWEYRHKGDPMDWHQIKEILDFTETPYVLETVKTRQRIYEAKRKLERQERKASAEEVVEQALAPIITDFVAPATTAESTLPPAPPPARPVLPPPAVQTDAKSILATLELERDARVTERLASATKQAELQERIKALESESAAKTAEQEKQLKLKVELQEKYQKLKEEAQTHKENLKDEKTLRIKFERDLKNAQSESSRRALATAGAARNPGKAVDNGFTFSNDDEDDDVQKKTPTKRSKSRKPAASDNLRSDGHPQTAGKSLPPAAIQALYKHLNKAKEEDEEELEEPPEFIQEEELSYFIYTVFRKQWSNDEEEPDDDTKIGCGNFTYLNEANVAVTNEILRPHGNASAIKIDPNQDRSLHQGMREFNMAWAQLDVPGGHVKVWVERQLHTEFEGKLPLFEDKGILYKQVWAIRQETSTAAPPSTSDTTLPALTTVEESDEIYTTFDLANRKANEKVFNMLWPEEPAATPGSSARKTTLSAVKAKEDARQDRKQKLDDMEDRRELFAEVVDREDGTKVKVFVVQKTVTGPRN